MWAMAAWLMLCLMSCEVETSGNGDLDGFWHLERVDTLRTGGACDLSSHKRFWAVQHHLLQLYTRESSNVHNYNLRFALDGDTLRTYDPCINDKPIGDPIVIEPSGLSPYGINHLEDTFRIERLSGSRMVLCTDELRLTFRKM